ncbi:MAG: hypothetical protein PVF43_15525 [Candidatus Eiseniibacteriota bacterium]
MAIPVARRRPAPPAGSARLAAIVAHDAPPGGSPGAGTSSVEAV